LRAAVGVDFELVAPATYVGEETGIFEHRYGELAVKEHPGRGDELVALRVVSKNELGKFIAGTDGIGDRRVGPMVGLEKLNGIGICSIRAAGTLISVIAVVLTIEIEDGIKRDAVKTCNNFASLDENHAVFVRSCQ
jgi:hypothetical protein